MFSEDLSRNSFETASNDFHITRPVSEALLCALYQILKHITDDNLKKLLVNEC